MTNTSDTAAAAAKRRALVLGGGGVAGIAWEIGLLDGLLQRGIALNDADFVVGTRLAQWSAPYCDAATYPTPSQHS